MDSVNDICKYHFLCFVTIMQVKVISCVTPQNLNSTHHTPRIMRSSHVAFWPRFVKGEGDALNPSVWGWWNFSMRAVLIHVAWAEYFISQYLPPWQLIQPSVDTSLSETKKGELPAVVFRALQHIASFTNHTSTYTDGSKTDEGVGCAFVSGDTTRSFTLPGHASVFTS